MPVTTEVLAPFHEALAELDAARARVDALGPITGSQATAEERQRTEDFAAANQKANWILGDLVKGIQDTGPDELNDGQKAITIAVLNAPERRTKDRVLDLVGTGFDIYGRITKRIENAYGLAAHITPNAIGLYQLLGADSLKIVPFKDRTQELTGIVLRMHGLKMPIEDPGSVSFPSCMPAADEYSDTVMDGRVGKHLWREMKRFDPSSELFEPRFITLGAQNAPKEDINLSLRDDASRYTARMVAQAMAEYHWLNIDTPGDQFQQLVAGRFAYVYRNLLVGLEPGDDVPAVRRSSTKGAHVFTPPMRERSLAEYEPDERERVFKAAGIDADIVKDATCKAIADIKQLRTARAAAYTLRAEGLTGYRIDEFFKRLEG